MTRFICPKSVKACAIRITRLGPDGTPEAPVVPMSRVQSAAFASLELSPDLLAASENIIRTPGGNVAIIDVDPAVLKGLDVTLKLCGMPIEMMVLLAVEHLWSGDELDPVAVGAVLRNEMTEVCSGAYMVEVWSKNVADDSCGVNPDEVWPFVHWCLPMTTQWRLGGALAFENGPLEITLQGYATANERWFPSFPGPQFPSYVNGAPTGPPSPILPAGISADEWEITDLSTFREGGPLGWRGVRALPEPLDDCGFIEGGCNDSFYDDFGPDFDEEVYEAGLAVVEAILRPDEIPVQVIAPEYGIVRSLPGVGIQAGFIDLSEWCCAQDAMCFETIATIAPDFFPLTWVTPSGGFAWTIGSDIVFLGANGVYNGPTNGSMMISGVAGGEYVDLVTGIPDWAASVIDPLPANSPFDNAGALVRARFYVNTGGGTPDAYFVWEMNTGAGWVEQLAYVVDAQPLFSFYGLSSIPMPDTAGIIVSPLDEEGSTFSYTSSIRVFCAEMPSVSGLPVLTMAKT